MPKIASNASDKENDSVSSKLIETVPSLVISTQPVVITSVQRKVFIGNYETVDVFMGIALPTSIDDITDKDHLRAALAEAANLGFSIVSKETADRYRMIKDGGQRNT